MSPNGSEKWKGGVLNFIIKYFLHARKIRVQGSVLGKNRLKPPTRLKEGRGRGSGLPSATGSSGAGGARSERSFPPPPPRVSFLGIRSLPSSEADSPRG